MHGGRPVVTSTFCRSVSSDEQFRVVTLGNKLSKCSHRRASSLHQQLRPAGSRHSTPESAKEPPLNTYKPKGPYTATIVSVEQAVGHNALGETCHVVIDHAGNVTYWEGHSYEIIPRGMSVLLGLHANDVGCRAVLGRRHHDEGMNKLIHAWFWQYHRKICL